MIEKLGFILAKSITTIVKYTFIFWLLNKAPIMGQSLFLVMITCLGKYNAI